MQRRFRIAQNLGFAKGFLGVSKSENRSKSDWDFPSGYNVFGSHLHEIPQVPYWFCKGFSEALSHFEKPRFCEGFFLVYQCPETGLNPTGNSQAICMFPGHLREIQ